MKALIDFDGAAVYAVPLRYADGVREGMLLEGPQGWGEFSPPPWCDDRDLARWLTAAIEPGTVGWPDPVRGRVAVAVAVPAVAAAAAHAIAAASDCRSADVAVGRTHDSLADDVARVEAVRDALGPDAAIRCHGSGGWDADAAAAAVVELRRAAGELEFVARLGPPGDEADVRRRVDVRVAVEASTIPAEDAGSADVALLRCGPLGGVRRALRWAERSGVPCVVASAMETSIGLAGGLALAGALPELPFACGLGTTLLLDGDVVATSRSLVPVAGHLPVAPMPAAPDRTRLGRHAADAARVAWWQERLRTAARSVG